jgi:hypothetical protein
MKRSILLLITFCILLVPSPTDAGVEDRLTIIHALLGEEGWRPTRGHAAILHVLERRRTKLPAFEGYTLTEMTRAYSKFLSPRRDPKLPHRAAIYALTIDTAPQWAVRLVDAFLEDPKNVKDPCRGKAWNWGASWEIEAPEERIVDCGRTRNTFLTLEKRDTSVARR